MSKEAKKTNHNKTETSESADSLRIDKFVVVRNGVRVSDADYLDAKDNKAVDEMNFWKRVAPDEVVEIVLYNKRKHRIW